MCRARFSGRRVADVRPRPREYERASPTSTASDPPPGLGSRQPGSSRRRPTATTPRFRARRCSRADARSSAPRPASCTRSTRARGKLVWKRQLRGVEPGEGGTIVGAAAVSGNAVIWLVDRDRRPVRGRARSRDRVGAVAERAGGHERRATTRTRARSSRTDSSPSASPRQRAPTPARAASRCSTPGPGRS